MQSLVWVIIWCAIHYLQHDAVGDMATLLESFFDEWVSVQVSAGLNWGSPEKVLFECGAATMLGNMVWTNNDPFNEWYQTIRDFFSDQGRQWTPDAVIQFWQDLIADSLGQGPLPRHDRVSHFRASKSRKGGGIHSRREPIGASRRAYMQTSASPFGIRATKHSIAHDLRTSSKAKLTPYFSDFPHIKNTTLGSGRLQRHGTGSVPKKTRSARLLDSSGYFLSQTSREDSDDDLSNSCPPNPYTASNRQALAGDHSRDPV